jgi:hypothetical protein
MSHNTSQQSARPPRPAPTSKTVSSGWGCNNSNIKATTEGCDIVCPKPIGKAWSNSEKFFAPSGKKSFRFIFLKAFITSRVFKSITFLASALLK